MILDKLMANLLLPDEHALVAVEDPGVDPSQSALLGQRLVVVARDGLPEEGGLHVPQVLLPHRDGLREVVARREGRGDAMVLCQRVLEHRLPLLKGG